MNPSIVASLILAVSLVVASVVFGGRHTMSSRSAKLEYVFILDRLTGEVRRCDETGCKVLPTHVDGVTAPAPVVDWRADPDLLRGQKPN
jgi:hypothetical protein